MKVMKLNVMYKGYYGGDVDEYVLLPVDINGVLFEKLEEGHYEEAVYLGEIEGKHSEVYGDLIVEIIDMDKYDIKTATGLIEGSYVGEFECYFEGSEERYREYLEDEDESYNDKIKSVVDKYNLELSSYSIVTVLVYDKFIEELKNKYVESFKTITVLEKDYDDALSMLHNFGIETY